MKNLIIILIVISTIILTVFVDRSFFNTNNTIIKNDTIIEYHTDTTTDTIVQTKFKVRKVVEVDTIEVPKDSSRLAEAYIQIYADFFRKNYYKDTVKDDTSATIILNEIVTENSIKYRRTNFTNNRPTKVVKNITTIDRKNWYFGIDASPVSLTPSVLYERNNIMFGGGYDIMNNTIQGKFYYKIDKLWNH